MEAIMAPFCDLRSIGSQNGPLASNLTQVNHQINPSLYEMGFSDDSKSPSLTQHDCKTEANTSKVGKKFNLIISKIMLLNI